MTAWSVAGVLGPVAVNYLRDWQRERGLPASEAYNTTMYLLAAMLLVGLACNLLIRPVHRDHFEEMTPSNEKRADLDGVTSVVPVASDRSPLWLVCLAWTAVGIPMVWGVWNTLTTARAFFE